MSVFGQLNFLVDPIQRFQRPFDQPTTNKDLAPSQVKRLFFFAQTSSPSVAPAHLTRPSFLGTLVSVE